MSAFDAGRTRLHAHAPRAGHANAYDVGPGPQVLKADALEGHPVVNRDGDELAIVSAIVLDVTNGRIAYAVLSHGGFLGIGDRLCAVPWNLLAHDPQRQCFVTDLDARRLAEAPGFDRDHWPTMANIQWALEVHDFYGVLPYWQDAARLQ